ncbi:MAG TPA: hypothetical protein H9875_00395 [Candidatus Levilactobacillus faecigallinarum]|uniref:Holin n=1 Tax=Candidatus Levilactobacillus faecigallinarum TaxID=2838638 RepID=A0A9D1QRS2_9LACO|nr:hypothetical protein [Candidatus Levilactobacillus faecigallinarum]
MNKYWKLSFNRKSVGDLVSVVFFFASVLVQVGSGVGVQVASDQVNSWASVILAVLSGIGFMRNTHTGTSSPKETNVSSESTSDGLDLGDKLARVAVPTLAVMSALSKTDRGKEARKYVDTQLQAHGFHFTTETIAGLVEKAYQDYKATGGDNHAPVVTPPADEGTDEDE